MTLGHCEECGGYGVDVDVTGADGRSVCDTCRDAETLDETSSQLHEELSRAVGAALGRDSVYVTCVDTGGGCTPCVVDLSIDGRLLGRQLWLTRETEWYLGFYDYGNADPFPGAVVVQLLCDPESAESVAEQTAGILRNLGVDRLQGE